MRNCGRCLCQVEPEKTAEKKRGEFGSFRDEIKTFFVAVVVSGVNLTNILGLFFHAKIVLHLIYISPIIALKFWWILYVLNFAKVAVILCFFCQILFAIKSFKNYLCKSFVPEMLMKLTPARCCKCSQWQCFGFDCMHSTNI